MYAVVCRCHRRRPAAPAHLFLVCCCRPDVVEAVRGKYSDLGGWPPAGKLPIVYNKAYNIGFWGAPPGVQRPGCRCRIGCRSAPCQPPALGCAGLERLHPFDSKKFQRVLAILEEQGLLSAGQLVEAQEATHEILREVHEERYLKQLNTSPLKVATVRCWPGAAALHSLRFAGAG